MHVPDWSTAYPWLRSYLLTYLLCKSFLWKAKPVQGLPFASECASGRIARAHKGLI